MKNAKPSKARRIPLAAICISAGLPFAAIAQDSVAILANAEDCAVMVEVGKVKLNYLERHPGTSMAPDSYGLNCDWTALGLKGVVVARNEPGQMYYEGLRFTFSRPTYTESGMRATDELSIAGHNGPNSGFFESFKCPLAKIAGRWQLGPCNHLIT